MEFEFYHNSLIIEMTMKNRPERFEKDPERRKSKLKDDNTKNLSLISGFYLYTGTPPHGYGTQAPKVAETILRAYSFNLKPSNKVIQIMNEDIERMHWEKNKDGNFPFSEIHGNFIPSEMRLMVETFIKNNHSYVDNCVDSVMKRILESNSDVLTKGRQTFCPFTNQSTTSATAYRRMYDFLSTNSGNQCLSCLEWIQAYFRLFEKEKITYQTYQWIEIDKKLYSKSTKQRIVVKKKVKKMVKLETENKEETRKVLLDLSTRFASYLKHKERGKKDRRAIASANMILRMFLYIIEEFHLELSKRIEGATISIGGEEKKQKISSNITTATLPSGPAGATMQGTEDATKWNECLAPSAFALMHKYLFDKATRTRLSLPQPTEMGTLFSKIAVAGNFLMSMKKIQIGKGAMVYNKNEYSRLEWTDEWEKSMNEITKEWYNGIKNKITEDREHFKASPGMLMGMLNAGSTTIGILATNHRMNANRMKVMTLRSSDDSMTLYMGNSSDNNKECVERNRRNLSMIGINLSKDKTFFFTEGYGEYTSWYMEGKFVAQFGTETAAIRPKGINPQDDFYSSAKETATGLSTLNINHIGATMRLRLGVDNVRRLWRVKREVGKRQNISDDVLLLADGGPRPWNCCNCHLEETCLREFRATSDEERNYLIRIRNPQNPFSPDLIEEMTYSKEHGTLILDTVETPRTCFNYLKKSNRTFNQDEKKEEAMLEKANNEATKIINMIDPTTLISYPSTNSTISSHLSAILKTESQCFQLDEKETALYEATIEILDKGRTELLNQDDQLDTWDDDQIERDESFEF